MEAKCLTLIMERIEPEVASMKSVRDDGSETVIFLKPSAIFYENKCTVLIQRKIHAHTSISSTAASRPCMSKVFAMSPPLASWLVMLDNVLAPWIPYYYHFDILLNVPALTARCCWTPNCLSHLESTGCLPENIWLHSEFVNVFPNIGQVSQEVVIGLSLWDAHLFSCLVSCQVAQAEPVRQTSHTCISLVSKENTLILLWYLITCRIMAILEASPMSLNFWMSAWNEMFTRGGLRLFSPSLVCHSSRIGLALAWWSWSWGELHGWWRHQPHPRSMMGKCLAIFYQKFRLFQIVCCISRFLVLNQSTSALSLKRPTPNMTFALSRGPA